MPRRSATIPDQSYEPETKEDKAPKTQDELRQEALSGVLQLIQFGCLAFGNFADAGAIGVFGPPMVSETVDLAKANSKVASKVDLLIEIGPYAGVVAAAIPFLAQLLVNHKVFKAEQFANAGVMTPESLESEMKMQVMQRAMEAKAKQMEMQNEMKRMQEEMAASMNGNSERDNTQTN